MPRPVVDIYGNRYGKLTVIERSEKRNRLSAVWVCRCECGKTCDVASRDLISKRVQNCGCVDTKPKSFFEMKQLMQNAESVGSKQKEKGSSQLAMIETIKEKIQEEPGTLHTWQPKRRTSITPSQMGMILATKYAQGVALARMEFYG